MESATNTEKQVLVQEDRAPFLSGPARSGELSPFAQKLAAEAFVCLCSIVVFGSTADYGNHHECTSLCRFAIATGVISFILSAIILVGQYLVWINRVDKTGWFSSNAEKKGMIFLSTWWVIGVAFLSALEPSRSGMSQPTAVEHSSGIGIMFGWLALFASIIASYKAYHAAKEEERSISYAREMSVRAADDEEFANFS